MKMSLPLYIHESHSEGQFRVRPLFHAAPEVTHSQLPKALEKLNLQVRKQIRALGKQSRHEALAAFLLSPPLRSEKLSLQLNLRRRSLNLRLLLVICEQPDRKVVLAPVIPEVWFVLERGQSLAERAVEVYTPWFRQLEALGTDALEQASRFGSEKDRAWLSELELDVYPRQTLPEPMGQHQLIALFSSAGKPDGEAELEKVGRCLNWLYPDGLMPAIGREEEKQQLLTWLQQADQRPVVLVGPPGAGKTALIHACVAELTARRRNQWGSRENVWQLAPQRLISGMSFVGQWEERLLAILETAAHKHLTLYFDDLPGLFEAGSSRDASLNLAQILRSWIDERKVRVLAEASPEAWQQVLERDRGLADQFSVLQLQAPSEAESLPMLLALIYGLESRQGCRFEPESLRLILQLLKHFVRDTVLPGKAARFLQQLASRYPHQQIGRPQVLEAFQAFSGLNTDLLETEKPLRREQIRSALQHRVIGQTAAIEALSERVALARGQLNDPERPLASLLFLGPTGVGKTECAKALAAYLYGSEDRLLRFDMNEYASPEAVQRLIGSRWEPEGLLTSAIRRQPYAVLLFDEIEKADPAAYDLLLQVLGEGRLSDARGRTADFTQTLIILTSNLGVRESRQSLGFTPDQDASGRVFVKAAEAFFRPEFFNRLDQIVPFAPLSRDEIARIASLQIGRLFAREGLVRRRTMLRIDPAAMEQVVDLGYHPQLGARALKRALERQLAMPVAMALARLLPETPTLITVLPGQPDIRVSVQALQQASPRSFPDIWLDHSGAVSPRQFWRRLKDWTDQQQPAGSARITGDESNYHHMILGQFWRELQEELHELEQIFSDRQQIQAAHLGFKVRARSARIRWWNGQLEIWQNLFAAEDLHAALLQLLSHHLDETPQHKLRLERLAARCSLLQTMQAVATDAPSRWLVLLQALDEHSLPILAQQARLLKHTLQEVPGLDCEQLEDLHRLDRRCLLVEGLHARHLLQWEAGIHLHIGEGNRMMPVQLTFAPMEGTPQATLTQLDLLAQGELAQAEVIRLYHGQGTVLDWRSGMLWDRMPSPEDLLQTWLRLLDLPAAFLA